jgi:hypothetical protein
MKPDECRDFLLALANAADRSQSAGVRRKFGSLYHHWFREDVDEDDIEKLRWKYHEISSFIWKVKLLDIPEENPTTPFAAHVAILRHKICAVWVAAAWGKRADAEYESQRLLRDVSFDFDRTPRLLEACRWLCKNLRKLRVCENAGCAGISRYFFRRWTNNKYCSDTCAVQAQVLRRMERRKRNPQKVFKRSENARQRMSQSAKKRWERFRKERE